jgi:hypothetical protein
MLKSLAGATAHHEAVCANRPDEVSVRTHVSPKLLSS